jgi:hypothetical protein
VKATIDIPSELYRQVKARSALEGRTVREVTTELYRSWLATSPSASVPPSAEQWLESWLTLADTLVDAQGSGATARALLNEGRDRLDRQASTVAAGDGGSRDADRRR